MLTSKCGNPTFIWAASLRTPRKNKRLLHDSRLFPRCRSRSLMSWKKMVRQGAFRDGLYDRLNMFSIWVPPLRARLEDIPLLVDYFISDCVGQAKRLVTAAAQQVLDLFRQYSWPGNIRELRNVVKRDVFTGKNRMDPAGRLTIRFCAAAGNPAIEARRP